MKWITVLALFSFVSMQSQHNLTGTVTDTSKKPIAFATIVLLQATDSTFYRSHYSDERGTFAIPQVESGSYVLEISSVGYVTLSRKLTINSPTTLNDLTLETAIDELQAVTVKAIKPVVTRTADRLIFNVENSSLSNGNASQILKSTPGVVKLNGGYLVGNKKAVVYINNKRVHLTTDELELLLSGYSGDNVKNVEVITTPPAQYDADGAVVININTLKGVSLGYKGSVIADYTIDTFAKYQIGTSQFYKNDWLNVYANYNYNPRRDFKEDEGQIGFFNPDGSRNSRWFTNFDKVHKQAAHSFNTVIDINPTVKDVIDIAGNILTNTNQQLTSNVQTLILMQDATTFSGFNTNSLQEGDRIQGFLNGGWNHTFNDINAIRVEGNYVFTDRVISQDLNSTFFDESLITTGTNAFVTSRDQNIKIYSGLVNHTYTGAAFNLSSGIKYTHVDNRSILDFFDTDSGLPVFNTGLSDDFDYDETVYAVFTQLDKEWEQWSLSAGLRAEQTEIAGDSRALGTVNTQSYLEFFPNLAIAKQQNENNLYSITYKRSLERPSYEMLNPFSYFINDNNFNTGNPNLTPAFANSYKASWIYKDYFSLEGTYTYIRDLLAEQPIQDNILQTLNTQGDNLNYELQYSIDANFYKQINESWYMLNYLSLYYIENEFKARGANNAITQLNATGFYFNTFNKFNLAKDGTLSLDVQASYLSDILFGSYRFKDQLTSSVGLYKSLWNKRAAVTVNINDLFLGQNRKLVSRFLNQDNQYLALPETQTFNIGFTYKFGNFNLSNRDIETPEEKERTNTNTF